MLVKPCCERTRLGKPFDGLTALSEVEGPAVAQVRFY